VVRALHSAEAPGPLLDLRAAVRYLRRNAHKYSIDPARIAVMGYSSGGWAAASAATSGDIYRLSGELEQDVLGVSSAVQATVAFAPPVNATDFTPWYKANGIVPIFPNDLFPLESLPPPFPFGAASFNALFINCTDDKGYLLSVYDPRCAQRVYDANPIRYVPGVLDKDPVVVHVSAHWKRCGPGGCERPENSFRCIDQFLQRALKFGI
jgi:acetyl esterase/lipase